MLPCHLSHRRFYLPLFFSLVLSGTAAARSGAGLNASRSRAVRSIVQGEAPAGKAAFAWVRTIPTRFSGEERGRDVKFDASGHVVAAGTVLETWTGSQADSFLTGRWSPAGQQLWPSPQAPLKSFFVGTAASVELDSQGNVISGGTRISGQGVQLVVTKRSPEGAEFWTKGAQNPAQTTTTGMQVGVDGNDDIFAVGTRSSQPADSDLYVVKLSGATGEVIWERQIGDAQHDQEGRALAVDAEGNVLVGGASFDSIDAAVFRVWKLSGTTGEILWSEGVNGEGFGGGEQVNRLALDAQGNVIAVGDVVNGLEGGFTVAKLAGTTGAPLWTQFVNPPNGLGSGSANDVAVDAQGDVVAVGRTHLSTGGSHFTLVKLNGETGAVLWSDVRLGSGTSVTVDGAGGVYATGEFAPYDESAPQIVGAWKSSGEFDWSLGYTYNGESELAIGQKVAVDGAGNLAVTGAAVAEFSYDLMVAYIDRVNPTVAAEPVSPQSLASAGGAITFQATAADNSGLQSVVAVASRPGQVLQTTLQANGQGEYTGQLTLPKNTSTTDQLYATQVVVTDLSGNVTTASSGEVTVRNGAGRLAINPKSLQFPRTAVGSTATRGVNVRNTGKGALSCSLTVPAPFSLQDPAAPGDAATSAVTLTLAPGARVQVPVLYTPTTTGADKAVLEVASTDPRHPQVRVKLKGKAK